MYLPKYFRIEELVSPDVFAARGEKAFELLDDRALITLDQLRGRFGPAIVNNWVWGGSRRWSGLRTEDSPYGSAFSQHRFGRAFDVVFLNHSAEEVRRYVLAHPEEFPFISFIELDVDWFHFDVRNIEGVVTWSPNT